ncbi:MAG: hemerythrin domain-containing protein [Cytophagaceae bacterium]|nr:hemerythrin domain-containing protein [Cytophagaceae bacterium]
MITKNSSLVEIISLDRSLNSVIERFDLKTSAKETIKEASENSGNNPDFIVEILKAYSHTDYFPKRELNVFSIYCIIDYLRRTHRYYLNKLLPQMEQSITQLTKKFGLSHPDLVLLTSIFLKYKNELENHIQSEETKLFPYIENLLKAKQHGKQYFNPGFKGYSVKQFMSEHHDNEISLPAIRKIIHDNSPLTALPMPYRIFLIQLELFEQDLLIHAKVEDDVLIPKALLLEKYVI